MLPALLPYAAVLAGMYIMHSAWWAIGLYHAGIIVYLSVRRPPGLIRRLASGYRFPLLVPSAAACSLAAPVIYLLWPWLAVSGEKLPVWMAQYGLTGRAWLLLIPYFSIIHPVLEELFWRNLAPARFRLIYPQDLLFAGYHVLVLGQLVRAPWLAVVFSVLTISSAFWRWTGERSGGYATAILSHAAADAGVVIGVCLLIR